MRCYLDRIALIYRRGFVLLENSLIKNHIVWLQRIEACMCSVIRNLLIQIIGTLSSSFIFKWIHRNPCSRVTHLIATELCMYRAGKSRSQVNNLFVLGICFYVDQIVEDMKVI